MVEACPRIPRNAPVPPMIAALAPKRQRRAGRTTSRVKPGNHETTDRSPIILQEVKHLVEYTAAIDIGHHRHCIGTGWSHRLLADHRSFSACSQPHQRQVRIRTRGDVDEIQPLAVEHLFGRVSLRGCLAGARQDRIRRGRQFDSWYPPPGFDMELGEITTTNHAAAQCRAGVHPCYYNSNHLPPYCTGWIERTLMKMNCRFPLSR